ncbi:MAG: ABC transporter substrate-binding protein [Hyphomicrobiales bacterium]|nr:ABC transporter substrate-binding protein [Hyphomicrobiales bacterium]
MRISRRGIFGLGLAMGTALAGRPSGALAAPKVRAGVLKFGTVSWELDTIRHNNLDTANGIDLDVAYFAGEEATNVGILAGTIDVIVSDWLWVSRQRSEGSDLTLVPYSTAVGAIMVKQGSPIRTIGDLKGRKLGIAGGPLDKSWLLMQAMARRDHDMDLPAESEVVYGAPPLLSEKARQGELDAVLNYWHFCARLEADGFRRLISVENAEKALGASDPVSAIGYIFHDKWAAQSPQAIMGFIKASAGAKDILAKSDEAWLRLAPIMRAEGKELEKLRDRYREGIPRRPAAEDEADAAKLYRVLANIGGSKLVGKAREMAPGTFWPNILE